MFGWKKTVRESEALPPPTGVAEIVFCIYDDKKRLKHRFSARSGLEAEQRFRFLQEPEGAMEHVLLAEAAGSYRPVSMQFAYDAGRNSYLHILPFEQQRGKWFFCSVQIGVERADTDSGGAQFAAALRDRRVGLILANGENEVVSTSSELPDAFGYSAEVLQGLRLSELFSESDLRLMLQGEADTHQPVLNGTFHGLDGTKRDVEVRKYSAPDDYALYAVADVTRAQLNEEITAVTTRERRRIGQDLHDSIGQLLTGISLLSRSLANSLQRAGSADHEDAVQISELADDASNQIRQISRGLMPMEVVSRGLYPSLRELARTVRESCGVACEAVIDEELSFSDGAVETHLYRIAQEAVNNAVRHSGGNRIVLHLSAVNGNPQLEVHDNGRWRNIMESGGGIGLKTMEYRASVINGQLKIGRVENGGTSVVCRLKAEDVLETKVI
ncbi:sensor histidine kinase [Pontiella agarivorans]|uniref:Sensor histidine kinase n=1 Tax=Pontiella agarivorans TaxID=3038953 RepID=A0ABU5MYI9_9BACT|nr:sensor histidine kinase [Pontiella agarivorans]MDZ8119275.1 sensor histidine kinase [Pontiella agarivorans]